MAEAKHLIKQSTDQVASCLPLRDVTTLIEKLKNVLRSVLMFDLSHDIPEGALF
jgi:hypothetical protein